MGALAGPRALKSRVWPRDAPVVSDPRESARGELLKFVALRGAWRARIDIMYSPPPDEAAEALARDPIDPVEATERFLEDAAADTDEPGKDEILSALRELRTYGVWLAHIDAKLEAAPYR